MSMLVPPEGDRRAKIAIVGEAPGEVEITMKRPFVGPSGRLLTDLLRQSGISRQNCYITNVVKERPPKNDISVFVDLSKKIPRVTDQFRCYEDNLYEEIEQTDANVILCVGEVALFAFTRLTGITKWRGSILEWRGRKIIPTIHPAKALREYIYQWFIAYDIKRALEESFDRDIVECPYNLIISPSFRQCMDFFDTVKDQVAFDIEVIAHNMTCFSLANKTGAISIPLLDSRMHDYFVLPEETEIWRRLTEILEDPSIVKLGQNLMFDASFMMRLYGIRLWPIEDTMIAHKILYPDFPAGLDFITSTQTKQPYYKDEGKQYMKVLGSAETFWRYNAIDSAVVWEAFPKLQAQLAMQGNLTCYQNQRSMVRALLYMYEKGLRVDVEGLLEHKEKLSQEIEQLSLEFKSQCGGFEVNPRSPKQLADYFYRVKGYSAYRNRKTGNETTDETALKRLSRKGCKEADTLLKIRGKEKMHGTYFSVKLDEDNRLRSSFNPVGTKQGRISSGKSIFGTGTNVQNLPPEMKRYILADEGYMIFEIDLSQAENRVVAYIAPEPKMIEAFEHADAGTGPDVHRITASYIFNIPAEKISDEDGSAHLGSGTYSQRFWGKKANHGLNYAMGYKKFALLYEIPEREAKHICETYRRAYPGLEQWHRAIQEQLREDRTLTNLFGRKRYFRERWGPDLFDAAYSFIPQSTVADKIRDHGLLFTINHPELFPNLQLLNMIHDSIVFQMPLSLSAEDTFAEITCLQQSLQQPLRARGREFVIPTDIKAGFNLTETKKIKTIDDLVRIKNAANTPGLA